MQSNVYLFHLRQEEFTPYYRRRNKVETTVHKIKAKFGSSVHNKNYTAQINELLRKIITHNICCLITQMHYLVKK